METKNVMIVGVGGQGSLLASKLLGRLLLSKGYDIKVSEVHGMSQRGGSVVTYVRYGDKVYSPVIDKGEADFIISFELLEAARWTEYLKPGGKIITNTQQINPMPVIIGAAEYPEKLLDKMRVDPGRESRIFQGGQFGFDGQIGEVFRFLRRGMAGSHRGKCAGKIPGNEQESIWVWHECLMWEMEL